MPAFSLKKICPWCVQHEAAQREDGSEDARQVVIPAPWVARQREASISLTQIIFGACVAVFLGMALAAKNVPIDGGFPAELAFHWGANVGPYTLSGQWWRLLTYMFLHGSLFHIAFNMWCLWDLGTMCESLYGRWTFGILYLTTGVAGGVASVGWNPHVLSVGASGAIFGLAGALVASFYLGEFSQPKIAIQSVLKSLVFFLGFNLFFGGLFQGIDNACHVGGLVSGLILGALIARVSPDPGNFARRAGVLLLVALGVGGSAFGVQRWRGPQLFNPQGNVRRMITELQNQTRKTPQDASAHYALAHEYFTGGQMSEGEAELKKVLELQPQNARAQLDLGAAYLSDGKSKEAKDTFTQLLTEHPQDAIAHVGLGMALANLQDHLSAIREYKTALQLNTQARGVYYQMGVSQAQLKQYDEAIASYQTEQSKGGDDPDLEDALADAYQAKGMTQQAADARSKAEQLKNPR